MDSRFIKLSSEEARWIKNHIGYSEDSFENILRHILSYHLLRKKETILKNKLKVALSQLKSKISRMELTFPEQERKDAYELMYNKSKGKTHEHHKEEIPENEIPNRLNNLHKMIRQEQRKNVDEELDEIKRKLDRLQK